MIYSIVCQLGGEIMSTENRSVNLQYTGHPLIDVGIAAIVAYVGKDNPDELVIEDLEKISDYMHQLYTDPIFTGFISITFTINAGFTQPGFKKTPEKREIYSNRILRSFREETPTLDETDVFLGLPVANVSFDADGKLEHGHVFRQHFPMQTGEKTINFHPGGHAGLLVSGLTLLAIHAYPLGSVKSGGRTLSIHSDNPEIMVHFANKFLEENQKAIHTARIEKKKMPEPRLKYRTLVIDTLLEALTIRQDAKEDQEPFSITAYYMTNSGQGAGLDIYHLPSQLIEYLSEMNSATYYQDWQKIERIAWVRFKPKRGQKEAPPDFKPNRNWLYEDLFSLAEDPYRNGRRFIRTYFLRDARNYIKQDITDPRKGYSISEEVSLISWKLTVPFLRRIMHMDSERIEHIRRFGDRLAEYIQVEDDKAFFRQFYLARRYYDLSGLLSRRNREVCQRGGAPLLTLDTFLNVFEEGEGLARIDWQLARDLVLIRVVEQLHDNNWRGFKEAVAQIEEESVS